MWKPILQTSFSSVLETYPSKLSDKTNGRSQNQSRWWLLFPQALWTQFFLLPLLGSLKKMVLLVFRYIHSKLQQSIAKISSGSIPNSIEEKCNHNVSCIQKKKQSARFAWAKLNTTQQTCARTLWIKGIHLSNNLFQKQSALGPKKAFCCWGKNSIHFTQPLISPKWWFRHSAFK